MKSQMFVVYFFMALLVGSAVVDAALLAGGWMADSPRAVGTVLVLIAFRTCGVAAILGARWLIERPARLRRARLAAYHPDEIAVNCHTDSSSAEMLEKYSSGGGFRGNFAVTLVTTTVGIEFWAGARAYLVASVGWGDVAEIKSASFRTDFEIMLGPDQDSAVFELAVRYRPLSTRERERVDRVVAGILERRNIHSPQSA